MTYKFKFTPFIIGIFLTMATFAQKSTVKDYLGVAGPIAFDKGSYNLAWTSHPTDNYYKQEYLSKGEKLEKFKRLILFEVLVADKTLQDIVGAKIAELNNIKATNPLAQYQVFKKTNEIMLDFLVSENTPDGKSVSIIERNVYRYKIVTVAKERKAVLLFGVSDRAYGNDVDNFLVKLKAKANDLRNAVGTFNIPAISIAK